MIINKLTSQEVEQAVNSCKTLNCVNCPLFESDFCEEILESYVTKFAGRMVIMEKDEMRTRHNCLNCKHCTSELTCDKDGENILFPLTQELCCCELNKMKTDN